VVTELFTLDDAAYSEALDSLGGAEYAQGLQSALGSMRMYNISIQDRLNGGRGLSNSAQTAARGAFEVTQLAAAGGTDDANEQLAQLGAPRLGAPHDMKGDASVWARGYGSFGDNDGDDQASGFDEDQYGVLLGLDYKVTDLVLVGAAVGYIDGELDFDDRNNEINYDGYQIGVYASYDTNTWYVDGIASYELLDNDSERNINVGAFSGTAEGDYDTDVFSGVNYVYAENDSFTETGAPGANLSVDGDDGDSFATSLGVRGAHDFSGGENTQIVLEHRLAWRHEFADSEQEIGAQFAGIAGSSFKMTGSEVSDDSAVVGVGATVVTYGQYEFFVDYDGLINDDYDVHAVSGGFRLKF
jgi:outer membrane autotransporter protein